MSNIERRYFPLTEVRVDDGGDKPRKIVGYAAVFNQLSKNLGGFRERIAPGAFRKTIQEADIRALFNHNPDYVLGRNKAGTLKLEEDARGLRIEIDPPETQFAKDLMVSMQRGDIDQMSFGFRVIKDDWTVEDEQNIRTLQEVELVDVSPVTFPAYPQTTVTARSLTMEAGFDIGDLSRIIIRTENGLPLSKEDREIARRWMDYLKRFAEPEQAPHSAQPDSEPKRRRGLDHYWEQLKAIDIDI